MNFSYVFSFKKNPRRITNEVTSISSLAPKILINKKDIEKVQPYLEKLKDTLNAKGINNIALTGGYGSGKSTLLKTFQYWNEHDYNFLNISLAAFNQTKTKENFKELYELKIKNGKTEKEAEKEIASEFKETLISNEELERQLEISILQQIIYKVKPSNLPESRFKRITNISNWKLWFFIPFGFILWVSSVILLFKYNYLDNINPNTWVSKNDLDWSSFFVFLFAFLGIGYFSKLIVELFSNSKINKVNLKGEIEIGDNSSKSILNEHYDEILYYFEKNNFNVVVIEDLDRFDNTNIFTKLRELNILLNNADSLRSKSAYKNFGIKFLYAVGDDLFNDKKERVKFFEYIIPVIPFINSSNANEQLKTLIKESELEENVFPKEFISDITTFIDDIDMRLLINIFHEFVIYRNILKPDAISGREAELFSMITYKNIDPEDFNKLNNREGKIYKLINEKKLYIQKLITILDKTITVKNTEIENIRMENVSDIEELKSVYLKSILSTLPTGFVEIAKLKEDLNEVIKHTTIAYKYLNYGNLYDNNFSFDFKKIENEVNPNFTYRQRVTLIENKHNNRIESLQKEIEKLKSEKAEIKNWDLKQIFKEVDINQYLNDFSNNGLLRNLILEGYINENYNDYISLFHEVSLTKEDKKFERNVKSGITEGFDYKLTYIENLIDNHIELKYFERETILNFDLLDYLGLNYPKHLDRYNAIISLLSNEKEKSVEFIDLYIMNDERPLKIFIERLVENWEGFWDYIYLKSNYTREKQDYYLSLIVRYTTVDNILSFQNSITLITAISERPYFLSMIKNTEELNYFGKIMELIERLNVKFEKLEDPNLGIKELFDYVYSNNYYQINKDNLFQMLTLNGGLEIENNFETSNYTTVQQSGCKPLIGYINSEIKTYVEDVYLKLNQNKSDNEETLLILLNNKGLNDKLKIKIIRKVETLIQDLSNIESTEIKKQLLIYNKIVSNWENVINYYADCENKIDEILINYLNLENVGSELSKLKLLKNNEGFEANMLVCNEIIDDTYNKLLDSCYFHYNSLNFKDLNESKARSLTNKILTTTKSNYDLLGEYFPNLHIMLIEKNFKKVIENINDFETNKDDILLLLTSDKISIDNKFDFISQLEEKTIVDNPGISKIVSNIILHKSTIIEFEFDTMTSIVKHSNSNENKVKLINLYLNELSNENIISLVKSINSEYGKLFEKGKPTYVNNDYNIKLLTNLKSKGVIKNYYPDFWDEKKIRVTTYV